MKTLKTYKATIYFLTCSILLFCVSQYLRIFLENTLTAYTPKSFIANIVYLNLVYNTGAAFGILNNQNTFLIYLTSVFLLIILIIFLSQEEKTFFSLTYYTLIFSGAIGNLFERITLGHVIDYIDFRFWPVFNLNDSLITVGGILLFWDIFFNERNKTNSR